MIVKVIEKDGQWLVPLDREIARQQGILPDSEVYVEPAPVERTAAQGNAEHHEKVKALSKKVMQAHASTFKRLAE